MLTSILFDVGDTIIDVNSWKVNVKEAVLKYILRTYTIKPNGFDTCFDKAMGAANKKKILDPHADMIKIAAEDLGGSIGLGGSDRYRLEAYIKEYRLKNIQILDNAKQLLEDLHKRFDLYVISNARSESVNSFLDRFSIRHLFKSVFISQDLGLRKEDGGLFRNFLKKTGLNPKNCLMVGNDLLADSKSMDLGIPFCLVDRKATVNGGNYTFKIYNLSELPDVLKFFESDMQKKCHSCKAPVLNRILCDDCSRAYIAKIRKDKFLSQFVTDLCGFTHLTEKQIINNLMIGPLLVRNDWVKAWPTTPQEIRDFYTKNTNYIYDLSIANMQDDWRRQNTIITEYALNSGYNDILDYGCGIAQPLMRLAEAGKNVTGVDLSDYMIEYVKYRFSIKNLSISLSKAIKPKKYDMILCTDMLEHVVDPIGEVTMLMSHIKPGGALALTMRMSRRYDYMHPMHLSINFGKEDAVRQLLSENKFIKAVLQGSPRGIEIWERAKE